RDAELRQHPRHQQRPERADLRVRRPRRRRRPAQDPAEADGSGEGEEGKLNRWQVAGGRPRSICHLPHATCPSDMTVAPSQYPPPFNAADYVVPPTDPEEERIEVGVAIVGGGPAGLACAVR